MADDSHWSHTPGLMERVLMLRNTERLSWRKIVQTVSEEFCIDIGEEQIRKHIERKHSPKANKLQNHYNDREKYMQKRITSLERQLTDRANRTEILRNDIHESCAGITIGPVRPAKPEKRVKHNMEGGALFSDLQYGSEVSPITTSGVGGCNTAILTRRVEKYADRLCDFREQLKGLYGLNTLYLLVLGDLVENVNVYRGQQRKVSPREVNLQCRDAALLLVQFIRTLLTVWPSIRILAVAGNHDRIFPDSPDEETWAHVIYWYVHDILKAAGQESVEMYISPSPIMAFRWGDHNVCLFHGDQAKRYQGVPYYSLERFTRKLDSLIGAGEIRFTFCGHHHVPASIGQSRIIVNGNFVGASDLSVNVMGEAVRASQLFFAYHHTHGLCHQSDIYLDGGWTKQAPDQHGIITPYYQD